MNGECLSSCPEGSYEYYSLCAPCMYGCRNCSDGVTCLSCSIGSLYQGSCRNFCPTGWVSLPQNDSALLCVACHQDCLECTVQPFHCTSCVQGLYLYVFNCVASCPLGTYSDLQQARCLTCKTPCATCQNGYSCLTCIYGYLLYEEPSGNQCISGPTCPNSFYLNTQTNVCVR